MGLEFDGVNGIIKNTTSDGDITIKGNDGGSEISLLTFDVSAEGAATFNSTITSTASTTITVADNSDNLTLVSTDGDANAGPNLRLYRNSGSPADSDLIGNVQFEGRNDNSQDVVYGEISARANDVSDGTEDGLIFIKAMTGGTLTEYMRFDPGSGGIVVNDGSADMNFRVESNGNVNMLFVDAGTDRVHFGGTSGDREFNFEGAANLRLLLRTTDNSTGACQLQFGDSDNSQIGRIMYEHDGNKMTFHTDATERARITGTGYLLVGKTAVGTAEGNSFHPEGQGQFIRDQGVSLVVQRNGDDGDVVKIQQAGSLEGTISVSGTTVSYNGFTGGHWSRLADNSKPTILSGTIMDSIDEMCDWYQAVADVAEVKYTSEDQDVIEGNKNVGDIKQKAYTVKEPITLPDGKSVGDAVTFTAYGVEYTGVYKKEDDIKHVKCKVSDTADSKKVYGVFSNWDDADDGLDGDVNDMNIAQVGTFIIRVHKDVTVEAGDLLVSNGDGTAKKQDDDIIRSKTVAKVNSNIKVETYSDGSYTVPCTLHC